MLIILFWEVKFQEMGRLPHFIFYWYSLIFINANLQKIKVVKNALKNYELASDHEINFQKYSITFSFEDLGFELPA